jgi:glycosyltransferase involved in cell wall biosynthesis
MPTHNRAELMQTTLRSVLRQRDVDLHVVIVDDGSSDGTAEVLATIEDERVRWRRHERPRGVATARNSGLALVETPWVAFTDDDDLWAPYKLASQLEALRVAPDARWSCVGSVVVDDTLRIHRHEEPPSAGDLTAGVLANNNIPAGGSGVVASTDLVRKVGGFDPQFSNLADWDLWIRLALAAPAAVVPHPVVAYRVHASGMAHGVARSEAELELVEQKYERERAARGIAINWPVWYRYLARLHLRAGDQRAAAGYYFRAAEKHQRLCAVIGAMCLLVPGLTKVADRWSRWRLPRRWADEGDAWLDELRDEDGVVPRPPEPG